MLPGRGDRSLRSRYVRPRPGPRVERPGCGPCWPAEEQAPATDGRRRWPLRRARPAPARGEPRGPGRSAADAEPPEPGRTVLAARGARRARTTSHRVGVASSRERSVAPKAPVPGAAGRSGDRSAGAPLPAGRGGPRPIAGDVDAPARGRRGRRGRPTDHPRRRRRRRSGRTATGPASLAQGWRTASCPLRQECVPWALRLPSADRARARRPEKSPHEVATSRSGADRWSGPIGRQERDELGDGLPDGMGHRHVSGGVAVTLQEYTELGEEMDRREQLIGRGSHARHGGVRPARRHATTPYGLRDGRLVRRPLGCRCSCRGRLLLGRPRCQRPGSR